MALRIKKKKKKSQSARRRSVVMSPRVRCECGGPGATPMLSRLLTVVFLFLLFLCVCVCVCVFFFFLRFRFKGKQGTVRSGLIMVLKTVRSDYSSHGSLLFSHRAVLKAKRTAKMSSLRFSRSDRTIQFGFQNLVANNKFQHVENCKFSILDERTRSTQLSSFSFPKLLKMTNTSSKGQN